MGGQYEHGWGPVNDDNSIGTIHTAVDSGVDWIDTAPAYGLGHAESVVGKAYSRIPEAERPLVFTKCGRVWESSSSTKVRTELSPKSIRRECEASLQRLKVERIDGYQIHRPDSSGRSPLEEAWSTLSQLVDEEKVRWIGLCNVSIEEYIRCDDLRHVDTVQVGLSLFRPADPALLSECAARGTTVLAFSTLASGILSGKFDPSSLAPDDWRARSPRYQGRELESRLAVVEKVRAVSASLGWTVPEVAISWVLSQPGISAAIVGARQGDHVKDWVNVGDRVLKPVDIDILNQMRIW